MKRSFINGINRIAVIGAFDRHNYGDLLFPFIIERAVLMRGFIGTVEYFSTVESNLAEFGAKPTKSLRSLFSRRNGADTLVIVAGGEVLSATWPVIIRYLCSPWIGILINRITRLFGFRASAQFFSRIMGIPSLLPFVYSKDDFSPGTLVVYNAVGGSHLTTEKCSLVKHMVSEKLRGSSYISVRDHETKDLLDMMGIGNVRLSPDCAVLVSDLFPYDELSHQVGDELKAHCMGFKDGYVCFQSALTYVLGKERSIAEMLVQLQLTTGLGVLIFNIGRAVGHSDQDAAAAISQYISGNDNIRVVDTRTIHEVMYVISRSRAYIGTSLHGVITAVSYSVPHIGLCPTQVPKLATFIKNWCDTGSSSLSEYENLIGHVTRVISAPKIELNQVSRNLKTEAEGNFDRMFFTD